MNSLTRRTTVFPRRRQKMRTGRAQRASDCFSMPLIGNVRRCRPLAQHKNAHPIAYFFSNALGIASV